VGTLSRTSARSSTWKYHAPVYFGGCAPECRERAAHAHGVRQELLTDLRSFGTQAVDQQQPAPALDADDHRQEDVNFRTLAARRRHAGMVHGEFALRGIRVDHARRFVRFPGADAEEELAENGVQPASGSLPDAQAESGVSYGNRPNSGAGSKCRAPAPPPVPGILSCGRCQELRPAWRSFHEAL